MPILLRTAFAIPLLHRIARTSTRSHALRRAASTAGRIDRIEARLPRFLRGYLAPLRDAPVSHISAFLILHELTAIVPLFGLAAVFHYSSWLPPYISEGKWVQEGTEKFGRWLRKRGWIGDPETSHGKWYGRGESGVRIVVELATAYAITKALLPLRLVGSVWATPWFARWTVLPVTTRVWGWFRRGKRNTATAAAGTGATGSAALPKQAK